MTCQDSLGIPLFLLMHHLSSFLMFKSPLSSPFTFSDGLFPMFGWHNQKDSQLQEMHLWSMPVAWQSGGRSNIHKIGVSMCLNQKKHGNLTINSSNSDSGRTCRNRAGFSPFFQPSEICPTPKLHDSAERSKDEISYRAVPGRWILWEWRRVCYMVIYGYIWLMFDNYGLTVCYWKWTMDYGYIIGYYNYGLWVVYSIWLMFDKLWFMATITIVTLW